LIIYGIFKEQCQCLRAFTKYYLAATVEEKLDHSSMNEKEEKMGPMFEIKNVRGGEAIFRSVIGVILIIIFFFISGVFRWVLGLIGVFFILTALIGY
jgi:hypothetical protein